MLVRPDRAIGDGEETEREIADGILERFNLCNLGEERGLFQWGSKELELRKFRRLVADFTKRNECCFL